MVRLAATLLFFLSPLALRAQDWPQFRGPSGQGTADVEDLPVTWSEGAANIVWKSPIRGLGWSSPVIHGERLWVTTADDEGRSLRAMCLNVKNGKPMLDVEVFRQENPGGVHSKNSYASPTPILAGDRVYVHFGAFGVACLSREGQRTRPGRIAAPLWKLADHSLRRRRCGVCRRAGREHGRGALASRPA
jgi:hypothetical protein